MYEFIIAAVGDLIVMIATAGCVAMFVGACVLCFGLLMGIL